MPWTKREEKKLSAPFQQRVLPMPAQAATEEARPVRQELPESDEEIMARLQARERGALDALFDRYSRLVFSIGNRVLRDHGEAEELVQEAFLYIYQRAALFDPSKGRALAWIVQAAFHRALNR